MNKLYLLAAVILMGMTSALAQDWVERSDDNLEYNCEVIRKLTAEDYANEPFQRDGDNVGTLVDVFAIAGCFDDNNAEATSEDSILYKININSGTNIRDAAGIPSTIVGKGQANVVYEVYSETEGTNYVWLEIRLDGEPAYVAKNLTTRLPDVTLSANDEDIYLLPGTTCGVRHTTRRDRRTTIHPVLYGEASRRFEVDVYKPGTASPVPIYRSQYDPDTNGTYQRYSQWWGDGVYTFEVRSGEQTHRLGFVVNGTYTHFLAVSCA